MSTIFRILAVAGLVVVAVSASAQARPFHEGDHARHGEHAQRWDHARWYGSGYYGPRYYVAPPVVAYPPAYYGPASINFNIPLG